MLFVTPSTAITAKHIVVCRNQHKTRLLELGSVAAQCEVLWAVQVEPAVSSHHILQSPQAQCTQTAMPASSVRYISLINSHFSHTLCLPNDSSKVFVLFSYAVQAHCLNACAFLSINLLPTKGRWWFSNGKYILYGLSSHQSCVTGLVLWKSACFCAVFAINVGHSNEKVIKWIQSLKMKNYRTFIYKLQLYYVFRKNIDYTGFIVCFSQFFDG